jgi:osmoprotectant transport system permease protein
MRWFLVTMLALSCAAGTTALGEAGEKLPDRPRVRVGSKIFTESVILGELITQLVRRTGIDVEHRRQLGGTTILWEALRAGDIDVYVDYTGTISQVALAGQGVHGEDALREALARQRIAMSRPLGYNNPYAIGMREETAARLGIRAISDLRAHPELRFGFSNEFMERSDGWQTVRSRYELPQTDVRGMEHTLAYRGLESGAIDATDLYSTDPEIVFYGLRVLKDDRHVFPRYYAVILYRDDLQTRAPAAVEAFLQLEGRIPVAAILAMNARAKPRRPEERVDESRVAADFLGENPYFGTRDEEVGTDAASSESLASQLLRFTGQHLYLVAISLAAAIVIAVPLGILAAKWPAGGQPILGAVGIIQTIPSLALLVFLIPLLGLGPKPAIVALFLYSLLPIVRNTYAGLHDIPLQVRESAEALGLPPAARVRLVELPLAARSILAGIKTSAVINVGTATLGGLIGAGGYGEPIMTGIRLDSPWIILQGAVPAALLALFVQALFELAERGVVPRGLRLRTQT